MQESKEIYTQMLIKDRAVQFYVDCSATVNVLPLTRSLNYIYITKKKISASFSLSPQKLEIHACTYLDCNNSHFFLLVSHTHGLQMKSLKQVYKQRLGLGRNARLMNFPCKDPCFQHKWIKKKNTSRGIRDIISLQ